MKRVALPIALALATASLVSCAPTSEPTPGVIIVASTNVYGSIAEAVAGSNAAVTSIIDSPAQDPHSYEAGARVQLELSRADVVIANGGGYDDFMNTLLAGSGNTTVHVITAVDASGLSEAQIAANEHVWYDVNTVKNVAVTLGETLSALDPANAGEYQANVHSFTSSLSSLSDRVAAIADSHHGSSVMVTEPVPLYLLSQAGFTNVTPGELSTAIENGNGVPPTVMHAALALLSTGEVSLLVFNDQTAGPETTQLRTAAERNGVPSFAVTETIPDDLSYLEWMSTNVSEIEEALH